MEFELGELRDGLKSGNYVKVSERKAMRAMKQGSTISWAFTIWEGHGAEKNGRLL